jgi:cytochrome b6-f complex iron-sulfur subunit
MIGAPAQRSRSDVIRIPPSCDPGHGGLIAMGRRYYKSELDLNMTEDTQKHRCSNCQDRKVNRRQLLMLAASSAGVAAVVSAIPGCGNPTGSPPSGPVNAGNVSALSVGTLLVMSNVVVARDANGVYAMSAICTHAGCFLDDSTDTIASGLSCPCHGSSFDGSGAVTNGPASTPLQHYAVAIAADGTVTIDGGQPVSASTRTAVS